MVLPRFFCSSSTTCKYPFSLLKPNTSFSFFLSYPTLSYTPNVASLSLENSWLFESPCTCNKVVIFFLWIYLCCFGYWSTRIWDQKLGVKILIFFASDSFKRWCFKVWMILCFFFFLSLSVFLSLFSSFSLSLSSLLLLYFSNTEIQLWSLIALISWY